MSTLITEIKIPHVLEVITTDDTLTVNLEDGRTLSVPLAWYPRLLYGSQKERDNYRLIGHGEGIHWPDLDDTPLKNNYWNTTTS
jgi:hypothetical protein